MICRLSVLFYIKLSPVAATLFSIIYEYKALISNYFRICGIDRKVKNFLKPFFNLSLTFELNFVIKSFKLSNISKKQKNTLTNFISV